MTPEQVLEVAFGDLGARRKTCLQTGQNLHFSQGGIRTETRSGAHPGPDRSS
jgi:hypothetical protein